MPIREQTKPQTSADGEPNDRAVIGGNEPPLEERIAMEFREQLLEERPDFLVKYEQSLEAAKRVTVTNDEELGRAGDLVKIYRGLTKHIDATHEKVKKPYLEGGRAVDQQKRDFVSAINEKADEVQSHMNKFAAQKAAKERAEREAREAEERRQAEAAAAQQRARQEAEAAGQTPEEEPAPPVAVAPAKPAERQPVRSDAGSTVSSRSVWKSQVTDYTLAFIAVEDNPKVREAIDKAIAAQVKAGKRTIDGVRIWETAQAVAR